MQVVFVHGQAASGKLTIARLLCSQTGLRLFHNHLCVDLVASLFDFGSPPFVELREQIWIASFEQAAKAGTSLVFTFQPEATVTPGFVDNAISAVESGGGRVHFVELTCPEDVIEQRMSDPSRAAFGKLNSLEIYRELRDSGAFSYGEMPEPLVSVSSADNSPEESVALIQAALDRAV